MFDPKSIQHVLDQSAQEKWAYPKTFDALKAAGVTHYEVITAHHQITYFGEGKSWESPPPPDFLPISVGKTFSELGVLEALRRSQKRQIDYHQFLVEISRAGCSHYRVDMASRTVTYMGDRGENVVEPVPPTK